MHEIAIADRILREASAAGAKRFFRVEVGELCEITKEELEQGLKQLTAPAIVEDFSVYGRVVSQKSGEAELGEQVLDFVVDFVESKIKCICGFVGRAEIIDRGHGYCLWGCGECGATGKGVEVLRGGEIRVVEVE